VMHEDIGSVFLGNKAVAFGIAEPLNLAFDSHCLTSQKFPRGGENQAKKIRGTTGKASPYGKAYGPRISLGYI
jgi:hypothetical protein